MKKLLALLLIHLTAAVNAAPWDLNIGQYDQFGTSIINRLTPLPAGGVSGIVVFDSGSNLPKLATLDSTMAISTANPPVISVGTVAISNVSGLQASLDSKFPNPSGSTSQYIRGDGSLATFSAGTVSSVGISSSNLTVTGSPVTSSGTIAVSLPNVGTSGTYSEVTTDGQGRVTAGTTRSQSSASRSLNSAFQVSSTRWAWVGYSIQCTITASIAGGQNCDVILEIASDSGFTTNVQTVAILGDGQTYTLAVALQGVQPSTKHGSGFVPPGYYVRLRTVQNTGSPAFSYRAGQEVLF